MPEGPEVRSVGDELHQELVGSVLTGLTWTYSTMRFLSQLDAQASRIEWPVRVESVRTKGKLIIMKWRETGERAHLWHVFSHLGMTGFWSYIEEAHTHIELHVQGKRSLYYCDARGFGEFELVEDETQAGRRIASIAKSVLADPEDLITLAEFRTALKKRSRYLLPTLVDPHLVISGVGNYIAAETLYAARLSPDMRCNELTEEEVVKLFTALQDIMMRSYRDGGMSVRDYRQPSGKKGTFMNSLAVYGRKSLKCPAGYDVLFKKGRHGRTIWYVAELQGGI